MMSLDEADIERIGLRTKLSTMEALEAYHDKYHRPLSTRVAKVERRLTWMSGAGAAVLAIFTAPWEEIARFFAAWKR
jgi:hypothetical protein